ncbi:hypothetical protein LTS18_013047, partial [Coniosporium uncinatum]
MTGRTVPCWDMLGFKNGFTAERPWLFQDFDLLNYYQVSEEELDRYLALFRSGRYEFEYTEEEFDMAEHNKLLGETQDEVKKVREKQAEAQQEMVRAENESLERWRKEKEATKVDPGTVEALLEDPAISAIEAPVDANVWKVEVAEGDELETDQVVVILEAMKLEIAVRTPEDVAKGAKVEKLLVKPGETIKAGGRIAL